MGRRSIKENKNIFFQSREDVNLTREQASGELHIGKNRIEDIENGRSKPRPEEVMLMSKVYKRPDLCNYYCSNECDIGIEYVPLIKIKNLSQIVLEMLAALNSIEKEKEQLIEITADGQITNDEMRTFALIENKLDQMAITVDSLRLWVSDTVASGQIDVDALEYEREIIQQGLK